MLLVAMAGAGFWVAGPGRSGAPQAVPLPAYGEALPWRPIDVEQLETLPDGDLRLIVLGLQPGFSASDAEVLSIGPHDGVRGRLGASLWLNLRLDRDPGTFDQPMVAAAGSLVVASEGRVVARSLRLDDEPRDLGPGISLLPGPRPGTVLALTSAGRSLRLLDVASGDELDRFDVERGRPLVAGPAGIVQGASAFGAPLTVWQPDRIDRPWRELAGSEGALLLGLGDDRVALAIDDDVVVYPIEPFAGPATGPAIEPELVVSDVLGELGGSLVRSELSPDGRHLAVGALTGITDPDRVVIVDLDRGEVRSVVEPALGLGFGWIDDARLAHIVPGGGAFTLTVSGLDGEPGPELIRAGDLNWWHRFVRVADGG